MQEAVRFPSVDWFQRLADLMNENRARHEHLGYIDCVVRFTVADGPGGSPWSAQVRFEEFAAVEVRGVDAHAGAGSSPPADACGDADFSLTAMLATWREMIESIARGGGRPDLDQTLNRLSHFGTPLTVSADDVLKKDLYFRYNQSLQEFVNASAAFRTIFE